MQLLVAEECHLKRSTLTIKQLALIKDFTTVGKKQSITRYPLANNLSYDNVAPTCQSYLMKIDNFMEPRSFKEEVRNAK